MPTKVKEIQNPHGLLRLFFQLPIWLFRLHLGWIAGDRFLLLLHKGRKSGMQRQTVLEVFQHDKTNDTYYVFAGWGERSDWVRNVEQTPNVTIVVGRRHIQACAIRTSPEETERIAVDYTRRHPIAAHVLPRLMGYQVDGTEADFRAFARTGVVFALRAGITTSAQ
jgi:deazaflavin-dependent oxidoreductase (nitroreductase family)